MAKSQGKFKNKLGFLKNPKFAKFGKLVAVAALASGVWWGSCQVLAARAMMKADEAMQKGLGFLASDYIDDYRHHFSGTPEKCAKMINMYFQSRAVVRLEWAAQACAFNEIDIPELYIGLAAAREFTGRDQEALSILAGAMKKFDKIPDLHYRMALILARNKKPEAAGQAYLRATDRAPKNAQLSLEAMEFFTKNKDANNAKRMADRLKVLEKLQPEIRLVIARTLKAAGDAAGSQEQVRLAQTELANAPAGQKDALFKRYADVTGVGGSAPPPQGGGAPPAQAGGAPPQGKPPAGR